MRSKLDRRTSIACIDDDESWLYYMNQIYKEMPDIQVNTYLYPDYYEDFIDDFMKYNILLIDHRLGGMNGANVVKRLFKSGYDGKMIIVSSFSTKFTGNFNLYMDKDDIVTDPRVIFRAKGSDVDQAVEAVMLAKTEVLANA